MKRFLTVLVVVVWVFADQASDAAKVAKPNLIFIMVDDMQSDDTEAFYRIMNQAIPNTKFEILDTTHPIFNCFFQITSEDILNQYYRARYNGNPVIYGVYEDNDPGKRLMAVINHNQDIGESWEFANTGYVPVEQANNSYKIGMNYIICSMLH